MNFKTAQISILPAFVLAVLVSLQPVQAAVPAALGWYEVPNTHLRAVAPPDNFGNTTYLFNYYVQALIVCWNSAVLDTKRNRLVMWGGGHADYSGNEFYAMDLDDLTMRRLNDPSTSFSFCEITNPDGKPVSRHTYDGIAYMENVDRMFMYGGSKAVCGNPSGDTWTFDFTTLQWQNMNPTGAAPGAIPGILTAYDPNTQKVFLHDDKYLYAYSFASNSYQKLNSTEHSTDYHMNAAIDPKRKKFIIIGAGNVYSYDIGSGSTYARQTLSTTGGSAVVSASSPGIAYDPVSDRMVSWSGGNTVYSLNLDNLTWMPVTYTGGPGAAPGQGVFGHWEYSPASNLFVVINGVDANVSTLRLTSGTSAETDGGVESPQTIEASPNPFTASASIRIKGRHQEGKIGIYNLLGQEVRSIAAEKNRELFVWDGRDNQNRMLPGSLYILRTHYPGANLNLKLFLNR